MLCLFVVVLYMLARSTCVISLRGKGSRGSSLIARSTLSLNVTAELLTHTNVCVCVCVCVCVMFLATSKVISGQDL